MEDLFDEIDTETNETLADCAVQVEEKQPEYKGLVSLNLFKQICEVVAQAEKIVVSTDEEMIACAAMAKQVLGVEKQTKSEFEAAKLPYQKKLEFVTGEYKPQLEKIDAAKKIFNNAPATYLMQKREAEAKKAAEEKRLRDAEAKRIADEAEKKLREEETKRKEAEALLVQAEQANETDKLKLQEQANTLSSEADKAIEQSNLLSEKAIEIITTPVTVEASKAPRGFSADYKYSAIVEDSVKALLWIVKNNMIVLLEGAALNKLIQSATNEIAKNKKESFVVDGCRISKEIKGTSR